MSKCPHQLRAGLPPLPKTMKHLPIDHRGFPVPYFVAIVDGAPDHRVMDGAKMPIAIKHRLCWLCGKSIGGHGAVVTFTIGPMCMITRTISEPPAHYDCARYAATACPFLTRPHAKRREAGLPKDAADPAGVGLKRNPGVTCLWLTSAFMVEKLPPGTHQGRPGTLFALGDPLALEFFAEGRHATRAEVEASIESGLPLLMPAVEAEGGDAKIELWRRQTQLKLMLDKLNWPEAS